jgi:phosphoserine phosphatase SerB
VKASTTVSLHRRLALLRGVPATALEQVYSQRLRLNPGVETFVQACRAAGLKTLLVSGGFTFFSERVRARLQLDFARANMLDVVDGCLTGALVPRPWGDVVDGTEKRRVLLEVAELMGISPAQTIAVGDGANDLPMMAVAGLSIAFHPKPTVLQQPCCPSPRRHGPRAETAGGLTGKLAAAAQPRCKPSVGKDQLRCRHSPGRAQTPLLQRRHRPHQLA